MPCWWHIGTNARRHQSRIGPLVSHGIGDILGLARFCNDLPQPTKAAEDFKWLYDLEALGPLPQGAIGFYQGEADIIRSCLFIDQSNALTGYINGFTGLRD